MLTLGFLSLNSATVLQVQLQLHVLNLICVQPFRDAHSKPYKYIDLIDPHDSSLYILISTQHIAPNTCMVHFFFKKSHMFPNHDVMCTRMTFSNLDIVVVVAVVLLTLTIHDNVDTMNPCTEFQLSKKNSTTPLRLCCCCCCCCCCFFWV